MPLSGLNFISDLGADKLDSTTQKDKTRTRSGNARLISKREAAARCYIIAALIAPGYK
jgi:hypothetical protein